MQLLIVFIFIPSIFTWQSSWLQYWSRTNFRAPCKEPSVRQLYQLCKWRHTNYLASLLAWPFTNATEKFSIQHCKDYNAFRKLLHFRETVWDRELEKSDIKGSVNSLTYSCAQYVSSLYEHFRVKSVRVFRDWIHMSIRLLNKNTICNRMFYNKNKQLI